MFYSCASARALPYGHSGGWGEEIRWNFRGFKVRFFAAKKSCHVFWRRIFLILIFLVALILFSENFPKRRERKSNAAKFLGFGVVFVINLEQFL
jgi:hypothetical protein